jgi:hypothetical protein
MGSRLNEFFAALKTVGRKINPPSIAKRPERGVPFQPILEMPLRTRLFASFRHPERRRAARSVRAPSVPSPSRRTCFSSREVSPPSENFHSFDPSRAILESGQAAREHFPDRGNIRLISAPDDRGGRGASRFRREFPVIRKCPSLRNPQFERSAPQVRSAPLTVTKIRTRSHHLGRRDRIDRVQLQRGGDFVVGEYL